MPSQAKARIIDGKIVSAKILEELKGRIEAQAALGRRKPGLAVLLIGDNSASELYVKNKILTCKKVGIESHLHRFPANVNAKTILACLQQLNEKDDIDGILVQLPLPKPLPTEEILMAVSPDKDVDGLHPFNLGLLFSGKPGLLPCTPKGIMALLAAYQVEISGKHAVVIGRSNLVGKPIAVLLLQNDATVTICHSKTPDVQTIAASADILVVAAGRKGMVGKTWIKPGACVIDVGTHHFKGENGESKIAGDVLFDEVESTAGLITPVPGGVGKMTVAMLMSNTLFAYERKLDGN